MKIPKKINLELEPWLHGAIVAQAEVWHCSESEVIQAALKLMFGTDANSLKSIVEQVLATQTISPPAAKAVSPPVSPTIRALQVGDIVQIRDQSSPHFLEKLPIIKVGMLMASVQTTTGEQSFLKRDLRFLTSDPDTDK